MLSGWNKLNPRLLFLWLLSTGAQRGSCVVPCPCCSSVKDNMKWTCLKSSWEGAVGRPLGNCCLTSSVEALYFNPIPPSKQQQPAQLSKRLSTAGSNGHGVMLEDVLTVTLLIATGKVRPQNSPAGSLCTQAVTELGWSEPRPSADSWVVC